MVRLLRLVGHAVVLFIVFTVGYAFGYTNGAEDTFSLATDEYSEQDTEDVEEEEE